MPTDAAGLWLLLRSLPIDRWQSALAVALVLIVMIAFRRRRAGLSFIPSREETFEASTIALNGWSAVVVGLIAVGWFDHTALVDVAPFVASSMLLALRDAAASGAEVLTRPYAAPPSDPPTDLTVK